MSCSSCGLGPKVVKTTFARPTAQPVISRLPKPTGIKNSKKQVSGVFKNTGHP